MCPRGMNASKSPQSCKDLKMRSFADLNSRRGYVVTFVTACHFVAVRGSNDVRDWMQEARLTQTCVRCMKTVRELRGKSWFVVVYVYSAGRATSAGFWRISTSCRELQTGWEGRIPESRVQILCFCLSLSPTAKPPEGTVEERSCAFHTNVFIGFKRQFKGLGGPWNRTQGDTQLVSARDLLYEKR